MTPRYTHASHAWFFVLATMQYIFAVDKGVFLFPTPTTSGKRKAEQRGQRDGGDKNQ